MLKVIVFSGIGPCPACDNVKMQLEAANIPFSENTNVSALYYLSQALGVQSRPVVIAYTIGSDKALIERLVIREDSLLEHDNGE